MQQHAFQLPRSSATVNTTSNTSNTHRFVIKTFDPSDRKVFINVSTSDRIPAPGGWADGLPPQEVEAALQRLADGGADEAAAEVLRFPLSVGSLRSDADKRGEACAVVDVVVNAGVAAAAGLSRALKAFLIDLILGHVGKKCGLELDQRYKLPKMAYKGGAPEPQRVRAERRALVREVGGGGGGAGAGGRKPQRKEGEGRPAGGGGGGSQGQQQQKQPETQQAAAAAPGAAAAAAPPQPSSHPQDLQYTVDCGGRPVTAVTVTIPLAVSPQTAGLAAADVRVDVSGQQVFVTVPGCRELAVQLPFAVTAEGAEAVLLKRPPGAQAAAAQAGGQLQLRLRYLPLRGWVDEMAAAAPRAFDKLPLASEAYMQLQ